MVIGFAQNNPCEDERYVELKKKNLDDMSDREYDYFNRKDAECTEYNSNILSEEEKVVEEPSNTNTAIDRAAPRGQGNEVGFFTITNEAKLHAKADAGQQMYALASIGTGVAALLASPLIGGTIGIFLSSIAANSASTQVPFARVQMMEERGYSGDDTSIYMSTYSQELKKINSNNAISGGISGCSTVFLMNYLLIDSYDTY